MTTPTRCSTELMEDFRFRKCSRFSTVVRDGTPYCTQHDPVQIAERRAAAQAVWDQKQAASEEQARHHRETHRRAAVYPLLLEALEAAKEYQCESETCVCMGGDEEECLGATAILALRAAKGEKP